MSPTSFAETLTLAVLMVRRPAPSIASRAFLPWALRRVSRRALLISATAATIVPVALIPLVPNPWVIGALLAICGMFWGVGQPLTMTWVVQLVSEQDRAYFGYERNSEDSIGMIDANTRAIFGRSYAAEPDVLVEQLKEDEAIAAADTLLLTVPNQLGVDYNAHVIESILKFVAPELGWR